MERAPLEVALAAGELPEGVYRPHTAYPIEAFALSEGASKDLAAIEQMLGRPVEHVQFDGSDVAQARALGAAHGENWHAVIVGTDVAAQLVGDYLARSVKELRKRAREERKLAREQPGSSERVIWQWRGRRLDRVRRHRQRRHGRSRRGSSRRAGGRAPGARGRDQVQPRARPRCIHVAVAGAGRRTGAEAPRLG